MSNYQGKRVKRTRRIITVLIVLLAAAGIAAAAFFVWNSRRGGGQEPAPGAGSGAAQPASGSVSTPEPDVSLQTTQGTQNVPEGPDASEGPDAPKETEVQPYDFSQPAPESEAVDNSYFSDAAFVGDSRTHGFLLYSGVGGGENLTSNGLSIFKLAEKKALSIGGQDYTLLEALALKEYGKVYLSLGVNELGYYNDNKFYDSYCQAIDQIREVQPNAVIYIQGLIPLNEKQIEEYNGNRYNLTNDHLRVYNDLMKQAAEEKQVAFLDLYSEFVDENGSLPEGVSRDGVHLKKDACVQWLDYLKTHTVSFDELYPDGPPAAETPETPDTSMEDGSVQG